MPWPSAFVIAAVAVGQVGHAMRNVDHEAKQQESRHDIKGSKGPGKTSIGELNHGRNPHQLDMGHLQLWLYMHMYVYIKL